MYILIINGIMVYIERRPATAASHWQLLLWTRIPPNVSNPRDDARLLRLQCPHII